MINNQSKVTVSAPGKLVLFGEHAVIYGKPCIVTAVSKRMYATVEIIDTHELVVDAPDIQIAQYKKPMAQLGKGDVPKEVQFIELAVGNVLIRHSGLDTNRVNRLYLDPESSQIDPPFRGNDISSIGLHITTQSDFSAQIGFGSSSAVTVCVIKALSELFDLHLSNKEIFDISYKTVQDIQKKGSGVDVAAAIYGGTVYFIKGTEVTGSIYSSEQPSRKVALVVAYSGVKADTVEMLHMIEEKFATNKKELQEIYNMIGSIAKEAKKAFIKDDYLHLGQLMNKNQALLEKLGVSTTKLDTMITVALRAGAYGAKLSGAGGGDCMIALVPEEKRYFVAKAIEKVGGKVLDVLPNAEGLRVEE